MKQLVLAALMALTMSVMAQTAPTQPSISAKIQVSDTAFAAGVTSALNDANTNIVYIQQSGITPLVNITQDGVGNRIGADSAGIVNPMVLLGNNQTVTIVQSGIDGAAGNNNVINTLQLTTTLGAANVQIQQLGNSNQASLNCSAGCDNLNVNWAFVGNSNSVSFTGAGNGLTSGLDVTGNGNTFAITMNGNLHQQLVTVSGDNNTFNLSQTSAGASSLVLNQTGTGATFNVSQSGTYGNLANVQASANGGSFNIVQRSR